jgi:DNA-binding NarL/FixJ family response regulator
VAQRIVIVDDFAPFRETARTLLETEGFEVVGEAEDGLGAVQVAADVAPDVVLLDVHLPDIDGFEVARRLQDLPSPPIVILTSSRDDYRGLVDASAARAFVLKDELSGDTLAEALAG